VKKTNALSIDLEDWYHPELVRRKITKKPTPQVAESTARILDLLDKYQVKSTFFILGDVAKKHPDLVKTIHQKGHEIASHGMTHKPLWELTKNELAQELINFKNLIAAILGQDIDIYGYRAPTFSLDDGTKYAIDVLIKNNYRYDSSIFPKKNYMYGVDGAPHGIYRISTQDVTEKDPKSNLLEYPLAVGKLLNSTIPVSGGFYLRVIPYPLLKALLKKINNERPFVIYFHPWETYNNTPRIRSIGVKNYLITYYGINKALHKIENLLKDFAFTSMIENIETHEKKSEQNTR
jgi:peptidoglycan-N-acetylglucosamine deacetylase